MIDTIAGLTSLEELNLADCSSEGPDKPGDRTLSRLSTLVNLRGLSLNDCGFDGLDDLGADIAPSDEGAWRRLEFLSSLDRLERLNLSSLYGLRDRDLRYVSSLRSLRHFRLRWSWDISDAALAGSLAPLRNLEIIEVSGSGMGVEFPLFTRHLLSPERVTRLEVGYFLDQSDFFSFLDALSRFVNLRELDTGHTGWTWSYDELLENLPVDRVWNLDQLRVLGIAFGPARDRPDLANRDDCFRFFVSRYPLPRLEYLSISGKGITDASVPYILSLSSLRWIKTSNTGISESGVKSLRARGLEVVDGRDQ